MKKALLLIIVLILGVCSLFAADYYIRDYEVYFDIGNNAVHHVEEYITVVFDGAHHGIVREIPLDYRDYNGKTVAKVSNIFCSEEYTASYDNGYLILKIGDPNKTVTGKVNYTIAYDYDLGADFNEGYDEIYLNLIGVDWECPIDFAVFHIIIPYVHQEEWTEFYDFLNHVAENTYMTSGYYGSTSFDWERGDAYLNEGMDDDGSVMIDGYVEYLKPYEGVTIRIDMPEGWYQDARQPWDYTGIVKSLNPILCILLIAIAMLLWIKYGKDNIPIVVARFEPPKGFSPLMVGYVSDSTVDDKDIISMLFYWADEGLLSIEEKKGNKYSFTKLKDIEAYAIESGKQIPSLEVKLFNGFFKKCDVGDKIEFKDLEKNKFYETIMETKTSTRNYFKGSKALQDQTSRKKAALVRLLAILPMVTLTLSVALYEIVDTFSALIHLGLGLSLFFINTASFDSLFKTWHLHKSNVLRVIVRFIVPVLAVFALSFFEEDLNGYFDITQTILSVGACTLIAFFGAITDRRTEYGDEVLEEILGYREFIDKVEIDQLKMMIDSDPDFYYKVLGYAVVLGLEDKWAKKFKDIPLQQPEWLTGATALDAYYWARLARRMNTSIPAASLPKSSISGGPGSRVGGSGFHSSGFSGGGFGGGGGHAW